MTEHEKVFFSILRSALWGTPIEVPEDFTQWSAVMRLAKIQALMGLVGDVLLTRSEIRETLPTKFVVRLQEIPMTSVGMHSQMNMTLQLIVKNLRNHGVDPVLLKGQGLARNYPTPELRQCGDIDLYVGVQNYAKSYEILKNIVSEIDDQSCLDSDEKHYHASVGNIMIEVHRYADIHSSSTFNKIYQEYARIGLSEGLIPIQFSDMVVNTPADNFNAFYVFNHMWHHFMHGGVGLRQLCDWSVFLHSRAGSLDLDYLSSLLSKMKLMKPWKVFGCIAVDYLGLPKDDFPFYESKYHNKASKTLERIMYEGNFGQQTEFVRKPTRGYISEKLFSLKCYIKRFFGLVVIFPYHAFQQIYYSIVEGIVRLVKDRKKR